MEQGVFYPLDRQPVLRNHPDVRWATCPNAFDAYDVGCCENSSGVKKWIPLLLKLDRMMMSIVVSWCWIFCIILACFISFSNIDGMCEWFGFGLSNVYR